MNYLYSLVGAFFMAFAVANIFDPLQLVTGGVSGLAIVVKEYSALWFAKGQVWKEGIPLWVTSGFVNLPLFIFAYKKKGIHFVGSSMWGAFWLTFFLGVIPDWNLFPKDYVVNSLLGGVIDGVGIGLVLRAKSSTGGADLLATLLHEKMPYYSIPKIMACIDGLVVASGFLTFGVAKGLYALVVIYVMSQISDRIIVGFSHVSVIYIISERSQEIADCIMNDVKRGITGISATGLFEKKSRTMLMCAASKKQLIMIKEIVAKCDKNAFVVVFEARETLGEGFQSLGNNTR